MNNYIQPGEVLTLTVDRAVSSGGGFLAGSIFGVATADVADTAAGEFQTCGVVSLAKTSAQAWTVGQKIYWDNTLFVCSTVGTVGQLIGAATAIAANPSSTGYVRLNESVPSSSEGAQTAIADLSGTLTGTANGSLVDIAAAAGATAGGSTPSATQVDTAIATAVAPIVSGTNEQLKELQAKFNALLAALRIVGSIAA